MNAYVRESQVGADTLVPMVRGFEAVFPFLAHAWLREVGVVNFFTEKDLLLVVKFSERIDAENLVVLWNSRN